MRTADSADAPARLKAIQAGLDLSSPEARPELDWLEESTQDPAAFWEFLLAACPDGRVSLRSFPPSSFDPVHDLVQRNAGRARVALRWFDEETNDWQALSYRELDREARRLSASWRAGGAAPGQVLAIVGELSPELLVALVSAWRLGLCLALCPPEGRLLSARRLAALQPDLVTASWRHRRLIPDELGAQLLDWEVPDDAPPPEPEAAFVYPPGTPFASLLSPLREDPFAPTVLSVDAAFLHALRDGLLVHRLRPGDALAAPGSRLLETQPCTLVSVLACGATYVHLTQRQLEQRPELLAAHPLRSLVVDAAFRDQLLRLPRQPLRAEGWVRRPFPPASRTGWERLVERYELKKVPIANALTDPASGGCLLFSARRRGRVDERMLPAAAVPWGLGEVVDPSQPALGQAGVFLPEPVGGAGPPLLPFILQKRAEEWLLAGVARPLRELGPYPAEDVVAAVSALEFVVAAAVVAAAAGGETMRSLPCLLVFLGDDPEWQRTRVIRNAEIERLLVREVGAAYLPARILFLPLYPRRLEPSPEADLDPAWCERQLVRGYLQRKRRSRIFRLLTALRRQTLGVAG